MAVRGVFEKMPGSSETAAGQRGGSSLDVRVAASAFIVACALALAAILSCAPGVASQAHAAPGTVYACDVHPSYQHPATGAIEDSGGASSRATGQAMVESCVSTTGMMEVTDSGECYLTIRMSLVDMTSGHQFLVQEWGDSGWLTPALGVTAQGSDANGTTNDVCIQLPGEDGIVRVSMFVESMGREVVFFVYADGLSEPAPGGFTATIVTEPSGQGDARAAQVEEQTVTASGGDGQGESATQSTGQAQVGASEVAGTDGQAAGTAEQAPTGTSQAGGARQPQASGAGVTAAQGSDSSTGVQSADDLVEGAGGSSAQGLSLSTAPDTQAAAGGQDGTSASAISLPPLVAVWLAVVSGGVALMLVAAVIVYVFRRNWNRWGGGDPDDYSAEYRHG